MSKLCQNLSHSKRDCKYHECLCTQTTAQGFVQLDALPIGEDFYVPARQKECQFLEGHLIPGYMHRCIAISPKYPAASVIEFMKGKSAIAIARVCGKERNFTGDRFWARGYAVRTVGFELGQLRQYIRDQQQPDGAVGNFGFHRPGCASARRLNHTATAFEAAPLVELLGLLGASYPLLFYAAPG